MVKELEAFILVASLDSASSSERQGSGYTSGTDIMLLKGQGVFNQSDWINQALARSFEILERSTCARLVFLYKILYLITA